VCLCVCVCGCVCVCVCVNMCAYADVVTHVHCRCTAGSLHYCGSKGERGKVNRRVAALNFSLLP
jgi:hypothetical protein